MEDIKLSNDMQLLADVIGVELTMKVIAEISGITLYVPKPDHQVVRYYYAKLQLSAKKVAQKLGVSERMVYRALEVHEKIDAGQLTIFDEIARGAATANHQSNPPLAPPRSNPPLAPPGRGIGECEIGGLETQCVALLPKIDRKKNLNE